MLFRRGRRPEMSWTSGSYLGQVKKLLRRSQAPAGDGFVLRWLSVRAEWYLPKFAPAWPKSDGIQDAYGVYGHRFG